MTTNIILNVIWIADGGINRFNHLRGNSLRIPPPVAPSDNSSLKSSSSHYYVQNNSECCLPTENSPQFNSRPERMVNSFSMPYEPNVSFQNHHFVQINLIINSNQFNY